MPALLCLAPEKSMSTCILITPITSTFLNLCCSLHFPASFVERNIVTQSGVILYLLLILFAPAGEFIPCSKTKECNCKDCNDYGVRYNSGAAGHWGRVSDANT